MKNTYLIILFAFVFKIGLSQNPNLNYKSGLKLSNYTSFENRNHLKSNFVGIKNYDYYNTSFNYIRFIHPTIAFQWKTEMNNYNEVELTDLKFVKTDITTEIRNDSTNISKIINGVILTETSISARYEYIRTFFKSNENRIVPSFGLSLNPYYSFYRLDWRVSNLFPTYNQYFGLKFNLTPRITYYFNQRFFVDINIPFLLFDCYYQKSMNGDPVLTINNKIISAFDVITFKNILSCRLGIGIKI